MKDYRKLRNKSTRSEKMSQEFLKGREIDFETLPRYLKPIEAAAVLRISLASFYKKAHLRQIPVTKCGGSLRVDKYKLEKYLDKRTTGGD
jgi:excisionase family DNA binding protein